MPINFVTGLPRQGKTLFTFMQVQERAKRENRPVYYCNIPEVTLEGWTEIDHPDKWMDCPNDSIIVVDELQDFWGSSTSGAKVPPAILELSKHGKRGIDFYFITQDPTLVHQTPRKLCETHYHVVRAFGSENAMAHKFNRMQTDPEKVKSKSEKYPWRYPKEAFGKKDRAGNWVTKPWYKSADVHNIKRQIPLKVWAIPGVLVLAGLAIWAGISMFGGVLDQAKGAAGKTPLSQVGGASPPVANTGAVMPGSASYASTLTTAQYLDARAPRIPDFPHTAPAYDQVTQPTEAPYPAACVQMAKTCKCYTQQATLLQVSGDVCVQIVAQGFFMDWRKASQPTPERLPVQTREAPAQPVQQARTVPMPEIPQDQSGQITPGQLSSALALRNPAYAGLRMSP